MIDLDARDITSINEKRGITAALALPRDSEVTLAISAVVDSELVQVVTTKAGRADRQGWFHLLSLPTALTEDIDANYGVAYLDQHGVVRTAGPDLLLAEQAKDNLAAYYDQAAGDPLAINGETDFAAAAETPSDGEFWDVLPSSQPEERKLFLELLGILDSNGHIAANIPAGFAWLTPNGVVIATGNHHHAQDAFCAAQGWYK